MKRGKAMKKKLLTFVLITTMLLSLEACSSKNEEPKTPKATTEKKQDSKKETEKPKETKPAVEPIDEITTEPVAETEEPKMLDDATKATIKQFVEPCIDNVYKTSTFYTCDILTPTEGSGGIITIQIEDPSFADPNACNSAIKGIIGKMLGDVNYSNIHSFEFNMLADSQMKFLIRVNDAQAITTVDDVDSHIDSTAF